MKTLVQELNQNEAAVVVFKILKGVAIGAVIFFGLFVAIVTQLPTC